MRYFIGYLLQGTVGEWHTNTAKEIADKFNTWKIYEKLPPHLTICYPEDLSNIDITDIRNYLKDWIQNNKISGNFYISGFNRFEDRVVFAKVESDNSVCEVVKDLRQGIRNISNIPNESFPEWHPHATLANKLTSKEINEIWEYTKLLDRPNFVVPFNNLTIFKYLGDREWVVDEYFELR